MSNTTPISVRVPANLRWDCGSCGDCCRTFTLGPVSQDIISLLESQKIAEKWAPAAEGPWYSTQPGPDGRPGYFLNAGPDGACVFLREDNLCAIHALIGPEAKPAFCREYPYHGILDPKGLSLTARADCSGFHESFDKGTPIEERASDFATLDRPYGLRRFAPERVPITPRKEIALHHWMDLEAELLTRLDPTPRSPEGWAYVVRDLLENDCKLKMPTPNSDTAGEIRYELANVLIQTLEVGLRQPHDDSPNTLKMRGMLESMLEVLLQSREKLKDPPPDIDDRACAYFGLILRGHLLSKSIFSSGEFTAGLGSYLFGTHLARAAAGASDTPLGPKDLGPGFAAWARFTHNGVVQQLFQQASNGLTQLFFHTPRPSPRS